MQKQTPIIINGVPSKISKNKTSGDKWTIDNSSYKTIMIIDALLENYDSDFKYADGITIINPRTTVQLSSLDITRPSNHIGIIRTEAGANTVLTYTTKGGRKPYYGVIKSKANIKKLQELKQRIMEKVGA